MGAASGLGGASGGGYYGRASELYALPHVCRINLFQPRPPLRLRTLELLRLRATEDRVTD